MWMKGGVLPGDECGKHYSKGFAASKLGPNGLRRRGEKEKEKLEELLGSEQSRCPFFVA